MSESRTLEEKIDSLVEHPIGKILLTSIRENPEGGVTVTEQGVDALIEDLFARSQKGEMLDEPLNELFRIASYFAEKQGCAAVEDACAVVVDRLGERLRIQDGSGATTTPARAASPDQRRRSAAAFLGATPVSSTPSGGNEPGLKPWQLKKR